MLNNLLKFSYWFDVPASFLTPNIFWILISIFAVAIIVGIISSVFSSKNKKDKLKKKLWSKFISWGYTVGIVGLILTFLKQQKTPYLGMRIWLLVWLLFSFVWLIFILKFVILKVPKIKKEQREKEEFEKYLP